MQAEEVLRDYSAGPSQQAPEEESPQPSVQDIKSEKSREVPNESVTEIQASAETDIKEDEQTSLDKDLQGAVSDPSTVIVLEKSEEEEEHSNESGGQGTDGGDFQDEHDAAANSSRDPYSTNQRSVFGDAVAAGTSLPLKCSYISELQCFKMTRDSSPWIRFLGILNVVLCSTS